MKRTHMTTVTAALVGSVLIAAIGLAGPASADPAGGLYKGTTTDVDPAGLGIEVGDAHSFILNPCGSGCMSIATQSIGSPFVADLHQQGDMWIGSESGGQGTCDLALANSSMVLTMHCPSPPITFHDALTKKG